MTKLLEGIVDTAEQDRQAELDSVRGENQRLKGEIRTAFEMLKVAQDDNDRLRRIINSLRGQLNPLHKALRAIFGEIDAAELAEDSSASRQSPMPPTVAKSAIWESWKQKLPGAKAAILDALLQHGELSVEQLCVMTHISRKQTIYDSVAALKKLHLIDGNNGRYSLKAL
jgi:hypothetical protein